MVEATILSALAGSPIETRRGDGVAALLLDLVDDLLRRPDVAARAVQRRADVVDDDLGALLGQQKRDGAADTAARAGDDCDFSFDDSGHMALRSIPALGRHPRA